MNILNVKSLFELCNRPDPDLAKIEQFIVDNQVTPEEITYTAIGLEDKNTLEIIQFEYQNSRTPSKDELVTTGWIPLFELFIRHGLLVNMVIKDKADFYNVMQDICYIDNGNVAPVIMRMFMENGGNPHLHTGFTTLFNELHFSILFDIDYYPDSKIPDYRFKIWLVLLGYCGDIEDGNAPINLKDGYSMDMFRSFEDFDYKIMDASNAKIFCIFNTKTSDEVAFLKIRDE